MEKTKNKRVVADGANIKYDGKYFIGGRTIWLTDKQEKQLESQLVPRTKTGAKNGKK